MNDFLDDLHFYCTERLTPPQVPSYQAGLRFGADFTRTVWGHSSKTSES